MSASQFPEGDFRAPVPVIAPGHSYRSITEKLTDMVLTTHTPLAWFGVIFVGFSLLMVPDGVPRLPARQGHRHLGQQRPGRLGVRHHQLRLVDRHRPRRHADFGDPAAVQAGLADVDQPLRGGDDAVRGGLRGDLPDLPHRPSVAGGLLAVPVSEHDDAVAELPQSAHLGRVRGLDLRVGVGGLLVRRA